MAVLSSYPEVDSHALRVVHCVHHLEQLSFLQALFISRPDHYDINTCSCEKPMGRVHWSLKKCVCKIRGIVHNV